MHKILSTLVFIVFFGLTVSAQNKIDRKALVERHKVINTKFDSLSSLTVGNGKFAFTVDITGLQTFPTAYKKGIPLGTQSEWGWHSFIDTADYDKEEALKEYDINGRKISYSVQWNEPERNKNAANWFRQNPHRLQLGNIGFELVKKDGSIAEISDIQNIDQELNPWTGRVKTHFTLEGISVDVLTFCHQQQDAISVRVVSALIKDQRLKIFLRFPYPTGEWLDEGTNYSNDEKHLSSYKTLANGVIIHRELDSTKYAVACKWNGTASCSQKEPHYFLIKPKGINNVFEFSCRFSSLKSSLSVPAFAETQTNNLLQWRSFWTRGGAIDFSGSTDPRAKELERRIVLSQYLTKVQCAGTYPPQETGLTFNSWFGKQHLEMHWWHSVHFALWGRSDLLEKSLTWYAHVFDKARAIAKRQGFDGVRWQKMTDPNGDEAPSSVGSFLIWQQPHFIYFAELLYRERKDLQTLNKYKDLLFATADFMGSYPFYEKEKDRFILGKGLIPAQERFKPEVTFNPTFELVYWYWALSTAQKWRERLHLPRNKKWDEVLAKLSPLPKQNEVYLATESATDSYTNPEYETDHPTVLGALGILPKTKMVDTAVMQRTFQLVWNTWHWKDTWGWDFPMTAMTATRLGLPEKAIEALLMDVQTNTYLNNGHNYQDDRLRLYLPGNGGLLTAAAMMVAGYEGAEEKMPGIPKNGKWNVRWEGLKKMP
jgi:hypothetical protein